MATLIISPQADQDLLDIWCYIAEDNPINADRFLDKLLEAANKLAEFTGIGTQRPELAEGIFSFPVDRYILYYRPANDGIELVRVFNASRDISPLF